MLTTLPTLSYNPIGIVWAEDHHSSAYTKKRAYPRTDLEHFENWDGFETEINNAITARMVAQNITPETEYNIGPMPWEPQIVWNEEGVRSEAKSQLHNLVEQVLQILGCQGHFRPSRSGKVQIIGEPDFCWISHNTLHPKAVFEYKTKWSAPLENLPGYFAKDTNDRSTLEKQSVHSVYQVYGYMTFNENKYGVLTNLQHAWFFQGIETGDRRGKTLKYYGPIDLDSTRGPSMLKAFVGVILLSHNISSPTPCQAPPGRHFISTLTPSRQRDAAITQAHSYRSAIVNGSYEALQLDLRLCHFDRTSVHHAPQRGFTVKATLARRALIGEGVFCKVVDIFQGEDSVEALDREVRNYATLQHLHGVVIPQVRGYYNVWGLLRLLALQDVGNAIPEHDQIDAQTRGKMRHALSLIHRAGYVHGDIARRNFCKKGNNVFLVDLETLAMGTSVDMQAEMAAVDAL